MRILAVCFLLFGTILGFSQTKHEISFGYGLNNVFSDNRFSEVIWVDETFFNANLTYHRLFQNKFEARLSLNHTHFRTIQDFGMNGNYFYVNHSYTGLNLGVMYRFYQNNTFKLSTGYSLGARFDVLSPTGLRSTEGTYKAIHAINLLNVKYFPLDEHFAIYGEVVLWRGYNSNFFLGVLYQF